ncbi:MAG: hypothetical protein HPY44_18260 [Armatimonadetes bacterium]|nr:hypothetical protein [Armatimonadota bacterium]
MPRSLAKPLTVAALIVCACGLHASERESAVTLDPSGQSWRVVITGGEYDAAGCLRNAGVSVCSMCGESVWSEFPLSLHPWMVRSGRFAGQRVVLIGVRKPAVFDPVERVRPFLYSVEPGGQGLRKVWLGTSLSRPFEDADFGDLDGQGEDELVAVERTLVGGWELGAYRWRSFGVEGIARSHGIARPEALRCSDVWPGAGEEVVVLSRSGPRWRFEAFALVAGGLVPVSSVAATVTRDDVSWELLTGDGERPGAVRLSRPGLSRDLSFRPISNNQN